MPDTAVKKTSNNNIISDGFNVLLTEALAPYIAQQLKSAYGASWWSQAVLRNLPASVTHNLPKFGDWSKLVDSLDISACLNLLTGNLWNEVFRKKLSRQHKTWAEELRNIRNEWAHAGGVDASDSSTERALDTMARFAEQMDGEAADTLRGMLRKVRYGSAEGSAAAVVSTDTSSQQETKETRRAKAGALQSVSRENLKSWREIIQPHPDVAEGRYRAAEFAADLAQVARGRADQEYQDPVEFFNRTYVTEGMRGLLRQAVQRVSGTGGEPIIQLKTAFGGGKTHSMLALYHLLNGRSAREIPEVRGILEEAGVTELPRTNVVTIVGTALNPASYTNPVDMPGVRIRTMWGEIAYQLAHAADKPELFDYVLEADKKGVSPGSIALQEMLDDAGPTLILMDELVAYAKKLPKTRDLPAGTLDNFVTFIQELTEAAKASKNAVVVASIPESEIEIGGEAGQTVASQLEHTFGRTEAVWKPVAAREGFEIVRRRLFLQCTDEDARDAVCEAFSQMYAEGEHAYPIDASQPDYRERLLASYPIHPEMFDRLYEDWSTLERFQRTRGVLRLMASVIHQLWMGQDHGLLIMPGSLPLNTPAVRDELTRYLPDAWNPIVDKEVDGTNSVPYSAEKSHARYAGRMAARRVARTILLGSAPTDESQRVRGLDRQHIRLGTIQPGENESLFNDALGTLSKQLSYLYEDSTGERFWYDSQPTLRKTAADKAAALSADQVNDEIERRLRELRKDGVIAAVHSAPHDSAGIADQRQMRLVVLPPDKVYRRKQTYNPATQFAEEVLSGRGDSPRLYRNMLIFLAPDESQVGTLRNSIRSYLAWKSIYDARVELQLTPLRVDEASARLKEAENSVQSALSSAYTWVLIPEASASAPADTLWHEEQIQASGGPAKLVRDISDMLTNTDRVIQNWSADFLVKWLDDQLWNGRDELRVSDLWDFFSKYLYLQKLNDEGVLVRAIQQGVADGKFGYVPAAMSEDGTYTDLAFAEDDAPVELGGYIVRKDVALQHKDEAISSAEEQSSSGGDATIDVSEPPEPSYTQYALSAQLGQGEIEAKVAQLSEEILSILKSVPGTTMRISLDVEASNPNGFSEPIREDVKANSGVLNFITYSDFSEELK